VLPVLTLSIRDSQGAIRLPDRWLLARRCVPFASIRRHRPAVRWRY